MKSGEIVLSRHDELVSAQLAVRIVGRAFAAGCLPLVTFAAQPPNHFDRSGEVLFRGFAVLCRMKCCCYARVGSYQVVLPRPEGPVVTYPAGVFPNFGVPVDALHGA